jgi:hypothetical protein
MWSFSSRGYRRDIEWVHFFWFCRLHFAPCCAKQWPLTVLDGFAQWKTLHSTSFSPSGLNIHLTDLSQLSVFIRIFFPWKEMLRPWYRACFVENAMSFSWNQIDPSELTLNTGQRRCCLIQSWHLHLKDSEIFTHSASPPTQLVSSASSDLPSPLLQRTSAPSFHFPACLSGVQISSSTEHVPAHVPPLKGIPALSPFFFS